jgi:hypothetical protein
MHVATLVRLVLLQLLPCIFVCPLAAPLESSSALYLTVVYVASAAAAAVYAASAHIIHLPQAQTFVTSSVTSRCKQQTFQALTSVSWATQQTRCGKLSAPNRHMTAAATVWGRQRRLQSNVPWSSTAGS